MKGRKRLRLALQNVDISFSESSKSLIGWDKQGEFSLLLQQVSQTSRLHQRQKDPAHTNSNEYKFSQSLKCFLIGSVNELGVI